MATEPSTSDEDRPSSLTSGLFTNLEKIRVSQDFAAGAKVRQVLQVRVMRPGRHMYIRVHPDPEYCIETRLLRLGQDDFYYVVPGLHGLLDAELGLFRIHTVVTKQGNYLLWPVRLPMDGEADNDWNKSALEIAEEAKFTWVRMFSSRELGTYDWRPAEADYGEPGWPEAGLSDLLEAGFGRRRSITTDDHPVVKQILGR